MQAVNVEGDSGVGVDDGSFSHGWIVSLSPATLQQSSLYFFGQHPLGEGLGSSEKDPRMLTCAYILNFAND